MWYYIPVTWKKELVMKKVLISLVFAVALSCGPAQAVEPLTDQQLDKITAGDLTTYYTLFAALNAAFIAGQSVLCPSCMVSSSSSSSHSP